jgi:hypothetical protein
MAQIFLDVRRTASDHQKRHPQPSERSRVGTILLFECENFTILPSAAAVWPARWQQIVITFSPKLPQWIRETAQLFNRDTCDRIAFVLEGDGFPATGEFYVEHINVGYICLGNVQNYGAQLRNSGKLPFIFSLMERELPFLKFPFSPAGDRLSPGDSRQVVIVYICPRPREGGRNFGEGSRAANDFAVTGAAAADCEAEFGGEHFEVASHCNCQVFAPVSHFDESVYT